MKLPTKIYITDKSDKLRHLEGLWELQEDGFFNTEYIQRDVVIEAMKKIEIDALDKACIKFNGFPKGLHEYTEDEKNKILNQVIDKAEKKGVAK